MREWAWQGRSVWLEFGEWLDKQGEAKSSHVLWAKTINLNCVLIAMGRHWRDLIRGVAWFDLHFWKFARLACRKWATCKPMMETGKWVRRLLQYSCWEKTVMNTVVACSMKMVRFGIYVRSTGTRSFWWVGCERWPKRGINFAFYTLYCLGVLI